LQQNPRECGIAASKLEVRHETLFYDSELLILPGGEHVPDGRYLLASWLGLNVAFVAIRLYVTADPTSDTSADLVRYPRLVN
jgi:hypothetical protein